MLSLASPKKAMWIPGSKSRLQVAIQAFHLRTRSAEMDSRWFSLNTFPQSIGILSRLLVEYEANPIEPHLERGTPIYSTIQCVGQYGKNLPARLRALVKTSVQSDRALRKLEAELIKDPIYGALIGTTQAIDLVQGGVKANALPEEAWALVNHRIATQRSVFCIDTRGLAVFIQTIHPWLTSSSVVAVQQRDKDVLKHLAKEFNLTYTAFGSAISTEDGPTAGTLTLTDAWGTALEPAQLRPLMKTRHRGSYWAGRSRQLSMLTGV